jgi:hypothetical protein
VVCEQSSNIAEPSFALLTLISRTMSIIQSHNVLLDSILVNNTGNWAQSCKDLTNGTATQRQRVLTCRSQHRWGRYHPLFTYHIQ